MCTGESQLNAKEIKKYKMYLNTSNEIHAVVFHTAVIVWSAFSKSSSSLTTFSVKIHRSVCIFLLLFGFTDAEDPGHVGIKTLRHCP